MRIKVKAFLDLDVDPEEYPIPSDGDITEDITYALKEDFHDINGININYFNIRLGEINEEYD